jgi:hypothetical protein
LQPNQSEYEIRRWTSEQPKKHKWFSDLQAEDANDKEGDKFQFRYNGKAQISSLISVSEMAQQEIVYKCKSSTAFYNSKNQNYDLAVILRGYDDREITSGGGQKRKGSKSYSVDPKEDGCMTGNGETIISIRTQKASQLPIMDIGVLDVGGPYQEFGIKLGEVCFGEKWKES